MALRERVITLHRSHILEFLAESYRFRQRTQRENQA